MVSHRAINDIMQTPKKEVRFFFFSVCLLTPPEKLPVKNQALLGLSYISC